MKTKLIKRPDIILETQADCYRALLDGFVLVYDGYKYFKLIKGTLHTSTENNYPMFRIDNWAFYEIEKYTILEEKQVEWYEDIPKIGKICWVNGYHSIMDKKSIAVITKYDATVESKYRAISGLYYKEAIPLTEEELQQFIKVARESCINA